MLSERLTISTQNAKLNISEVNMQEITIEERIKYEIEDIDNYISTFSNLEETVEAWSSLIIRYEGIKHDLKMDEKTYKKLELISMSMDNTAKEEVKKITSRIRQLIHKNKLFVANEEFFDIKDKFDNIINSKIPMASFEEYKELSGILNKLIQIIKTEKEITNIGELSFK